MTALRCPRRPIPKRHRLEGYAIEKPDHPERSRSDTLNPTALERIKAAICRESGPAAVADAKAELRRAIAEAIEASEAEGEA